MSMLPIKTLPFLANLAETKAHGSHGGLCYEPQMSCEITLWNVCLSSSKFNTVLLVRWSMIFC